jgi:DNA-directed RNA polymerase
MMKEGSVADAQALQNGKLQSWMHDWYRALTAKLRDDINALKEKVEEKDFEISALKPSPSHGMKDPALLLFLTLLPVEKLALITVLEIMRMAGSGGVVDGMKALRGMLSVGKAVETEYRADTIRNFSGVDSPQWQRTIDPTTQRPSRQLVTQVWQRLGHQVREGKAGSSTSDPAVEADWRSIWTPTWSQPTHVGVGSFLIEALLSVAKVERKGRDPETGEPV